MEVAPVDPSTNKPKTDIRIKDVTIFVDPFEEFMNQRQAEETSASAGTQKSKHPSGGDGVRREENGFNEEDDQITWTGKRVRGVFDNGGKTAADTGGVGKYLKAALADQQAAASAAHGHGSRGEEDEIVEFVDEVPEPEPEHVRKKLKAGRGQGGFGNFDSW